MNAIAPACRPLFARPLPASSRASWRPLAVRLCAAAALVFLSGCQTPERRDVLQRMNQIQAENSALKAKSESEVTQTKLDAARQRQEDMRVIEALNRRFEELSRKLEALHSAPPPKAVEPGKTEPGKTEAKPEPAGRDAGPTTTVQAELERARAEARAEMARMEEALAKAQAQAEAAKLAAAAAERAPKESSKQSDFKGKALPLTKFIDSSGKLVDLSKFTKEKLVVLSVMKGFYSQGVCVYCTRQTADFARNAKAFKDLGVEMLVVYPGKEEHINTFVRTVRDYEKSDDPRFQLPFKVLLDVNQDAVRALDIAGDLANPSTFVLDTQGLVRYQYVGRSMSDRPTAANILDEIRKIGGGVKP